MKRTPIDRIISELGSRAALARLLQMPETTVKYWHKETGIIPADVAVALEKKSKGRFPRYISRPDLWPKELG